MNGYGVLKNALSLIGIGEVSEDIKLSGSSIVNTVLDDLGFAPKRSLAEEIKGLDPAAEQALVHGTAMLLCAANGDDAGRECFSVTYHAKRMKLKNSISRVRDTLPRGVDL